MPVILPHTQRTHGAFSKLPSPITFASPHTFSSFLRGTASHFVLTFGQGHSLRFPALDHLTPAYRQLRFHIIISCS